MSTATNRGEAGISQHSSKTDQMSGADVIKSLSTLFYSF